MIDLWLTCDWPAEASLTRISWWKLQHALDVLDCICACAWMNGPTGLEFTNIWTKVYSSWWFHLGTESGKLWRWQHLHQSRRQQAPLATSRGQMFGHMPLLLDICWLNYKSVLHSLANPKKVLCLQQKFLRHPRSMESLSECRYYHVTITLL